MWHFLQRLGVFDAKPVGALGHLQDVLGFLSCEVGIVLGAKAEPNRVGVGHSAIDSNVFSGLKVELSYDVLDVHCAFGFYA